MWGFGDLATWEFGEARIWELRNSEIQRSMGSGDMKSGSLGFSDRNAGALGFRPCYVQQYIILWLVTITIGFPMDLLQTFGD